MANRLHCTLYPSWARFLGSRTSFIRAQTTSRHGPSTGEILVRHGWAKVIYTTKSIHAEPIFLVRALFSSELRQKFWLCKWGLNSKLYDSGPPVVYQDLSMWHDWLVKKARCQILYQDERKFTETYLQLWLFISCIGGAEQRYQCCFTRLNYICNAHAG